MRILLVPRLIGVGAAVALLGIVTWLVDAAMNGVAWAIAALGIGVVVVRRRSIAVAFVTAQALLLAAAAFSEGGSLDDAVAATALGDPRRTARRTVPLPCPRERGRRDLCGPALHRSLVPQPPSRSRWR